MTLQEKITKYFDGKVVRKDLAKGITLTGRTGTYQVDMLPKVQLNIVLSDHNVDRTIETIIEAASTKTEGDGMIFVTPVHEVIRIRTGERNAEALSYRGDIDARRAAK